MISYKYKMYKNKNLKHFSDMLKEASFVWNHALSIQKRYYRIYKKYVSSNRMQKHFAKRIKRNRLHSQTVQEIIQRLDESYKRFFKKIQKRPPKFKKSIHFTSIVYKQGGYTLNGNTLTINSIKKRFRFSLSRPYDGVVKRISIKRSPVGDYYLIIMLDKPVDQKEKTHNGASIGIDFGLKTYLTLSNEDTVLNPLFLKKDINRIKSASRRLSRSKKGSNNRKRRLMELNRIHESVRNKRSDFQFKLANSLCRTYDNIFIEDLSLSGMSRIWGRKMSDLSHGSFILTLQYIASKYDVNVHKIDRWFPSSKMCECGFINKSLKLSDRIWVCQECGLINDRDLNASKNILRKGISEMRSKCKTPTIGAVYV